MKKIMLILFFLPFLYLDAAGNKPGSMKEYMESQALYWEQLPYQWNEGAFVGNGILGMVAYVDSLDNTLTFWLGRSDVTDHRKAPGRKTSLGVPGASVMADFCRLDIGKIKLRPETKILSGHFRQDIYDGEITGSVETGAGTFRFRAYTLREHEVNVIETDYEGKLECIYKAARPYSPRFQAYPGQRAMFAYRNNPDPILSETREGGCCVYPMTAGGDYAVCWKYAEDKSVIYVSAANETPLAGQSATKAEAEVKAVQQAGIQAVRKRMNEWWHAYWDTSLIDIPDKQMENFYHIQMYKLAVSSTPDGPAMDNMGVLYKTTQWPGIWWNLNIQLTYMSTLTTNRLEQAQNFLRLMDDCFMPVLNAAGVAKTGDYAWALHTYYSILRYQGASWTEIEERVMPKLEAVIGRYRSATVLKDGVLHLMQTESPEYEGFLKYDNSNYNLGLFRWALETAQTICVQNGRQNPEMKEWEQLEKDLYPYPVDENGYMIGSGRALDKSHRHYSHLLSFYPLRLHDMDDDYTCGILRKSLEHWLGLEDGRELAGYSYTGAASLYALLGDGDEAYRYLKRFLNAPIGISLLLPNTLYVETDGRNPVIETPLSAATALADLLLQTRKGVICPFPAIPSGWDDCAFRNLRAEGGWTVSASRKAGRTDWISIGSKDGGECILRLPDWDRVVCLNRDDCRIVPLGHDEYSVYVEAGSTVCLSDRESATPVWHVPSSAPCSYYGVKEGKGLDKLMDWPE